MEKIDIIRKTKERGITLITLAVAVCIMIVISTMLIYNAKNGLKMRNIKMMENDIEMLDDKINSYYVKYGALPISHRYTNIKFEPQANDSQEYYVIDLNALEELTLNYGHEFSLITESTTEDEIQKYEDLYIIDKQSHHVYYAKGIEMDGVIYHTNTIDDEITLVEIPKEIKVTLSRSETESEWVKEITLTGKGKVKEAVQDEIKIVGYIFNQDETGENILDSDWTKVNKKQQLQLSVENTINENGEYYFWIIDNEGETYRSNVIKIENIDNTLPTVGTIIAREEDSTGTEYEQGTWTDKNIYIEKVDGTDEESGHKQTTYTVIKGTETIYENITDSITLTESGSYTIIVKTEDNAGNIATSEPITIKIDKEVPVLALKHNDSTGADYEQGTWTNDDLYGEITIDTSETGQTVEKYQYSYNGVVWYDISSEIVQMNLDYTTTFPLTEDKPDWFTGPIAANSSNNSNGTYYFEVQEDGTLKPNNSGVNSTTANSYFEIDLSNYPEAELEITINATISSESNYDFGYATILTTTTAPAYSSSTGRFIYVSGETTTADYTTTLTGGTKYYLHIGYRKDSSQNKNQDTFIINNISLKADKLESGINFYEYIKNDNKVSFKLQDEIEKDVYIRAVYSGENNISKYGSSTSIKIDKTAPVIESATSTITSQTTAKANVTVVEEKSGLSGYYVSTEETEPTESSTWTEQILNEFTIEGLNAETTYYIWLKDNAGNISEKYEITTSKPNYLVDDSIYVEKLADAITKASDGSIIKLLNDYTDDSAATLDRNLTFDVQSYTLIRTQTTTINSGNTVEITGKGKITNETRTIDTITNNGTVIISDSIVIENQSTASNNDVIYNKSIANINDNVKIIGSYRGITNKYGTLNINGGHIEATNQNNSAYGIYNYSSSEIYINSGEVKGYYGIYNSGTVEMVDGKIKGTGAYGIEAYGTTNIHGGRIEGKTYGIYSTATDKVTIGKQEDELSTTQPAIYGASYGIYMKDATYSFNFYNGVIISNTKETAYQGIANLRENHMPYTYLDYEVEQKYCTILVPIAENTTMEATPTEYTNKEVIVKITYPYISNIVRQYSENGSNWLEAEQYIQEVIVGENKTIYARTLNESEILTEENQIEVNNIDKENPIVTVSSAETNYIITEENGTTDITITITAEDTGVSGLDIMQYGWAKEGEEVTYIDFSNEITINNTNISVGTYNLYLNVTDKAGNKAELEQIRYNVKYQEPVAQIGETKYLTIQEAIEACSKEAGEEQTTIIILKSTDEEFNTYEGQNIILDLKGYTIGSSNTETSICTNNGTLTIIDSSTEKTGKLESLNATAILNTSTGTLTIGDNNTSIENEVPTIYGKKVGIKNEGTFNYYDGKIQGTVPIQGKVADTPEGYGPVSTEYSNGITTVQLGIVSGYEARIEWVYYTTVQEAINATKHYTNENRDIVTIIVNVQLKEILEINIAKNMILDLNGYELMIVPEKDRVIDNYGNIEVTDSSIEQTGKIQIETSKPGNNLWSSLKTSGIYNNGTGNVLISGGIINSNSTGSYNYAYGIYNASAGRVEITGGEISNSNSDSYGIYNESTGIVEMTGGTISSSGNGRSYGIYNASRGTVEVTGGTVSISHRNSYGIYNASAGRVEVAGGEISSSSSSTNYISIYSYGIYNASTGRVEITGGEISSSSSSSNNSGNGRSYGIYNASAGRVEVAGGEISSSTNYISIYSYGIYNESTGRVEITGGEISSSSIYSESYGIYNASTGIVEMTGGTISSSSSSHKDSYGIYNESTGIVEMTGGTISSSGNYRSYGIYNKSTGTITIGTKGDGEVSQESPYIKGEHTRTTTYYGYGVYNTNGNLYFYDGKIEGNKANEGIITKIREGYEITKEEKEKTEVIYLKEKEEEEIVQIEETKYTSLQEAIDSIGEEEKTIQVIKDFELKESIEFNKNVILDMNGYVITNNYWTIKNSKNLKIADTTEEKTGEIKNIETVKGITNEGSIEVQGGTISSSNSNNYSYGIYNASIGSVVVTGGTISSGNSYYNSSSSYGIYNASTGSVEVKGGTVSGSSSTSKFSYGIYNASTGSVVVTGGTINSSNSSNINNYSYGIYNASEGNVIVTGGTVSSTNRDSYGIYNSGTGSVVVTGGTISSGSSSPNSYGIYNASTGSVEVKGGTVSGSSSNSNTTSASSYGVFNKSTGTITIGTKEDGEVSQESPYIKGEDTRTSSSYVGYGIYNTKGYLYYYDGKIEGTTKAVYDTITEIEEETELNYNEDETVVTLSSEITDIAQIGEITYQTLEEAINAAEEQNVIKLLRNATFTNQDTVITIPNTKNIILDLNGYKITSSIEEKVIQNDGVLKIIDTSEEQKGTIVTVEETTIENIEGAQLTIAGGTIQNRTKQAIYNEGELKIEEGIVSSSSSSSSSYGIYNGSTGSVEVKGGTVSGIGNGIGKYSYGIYNESTGSVKMTGGEISSSSSYSYGIYNAITGSVVVEGGTISSGHFGICNASTGSVKVTGGEISSEYGIYNASTGIVEMTGGEISSRYGIYNASTGIVEMTGGTISSSGNDRSYGIYNKSTGTITIGTKGDGEVSQESPYIKGEHTGTTTYYGYGVYNTNGNLYFYDGKIEGTTRAIYNAITEIEDNTELLVTKDSTEIIQLEQKETNAVSVNGTEYTSIEKAIQACGESESTIQILRDANPGATIIIESNQNITIDLNGFTVNNYLEITNKGTLKIIDSSESQTGKMIGLTGTVIVNEGTMELNGGSISDTAYGINNKGTLTVNGGSVTNNTYGIYNSSGTTNIISGTISSNTYGIYNYSGTTQITGGSINSNTYGMYTYSGTVNIKSTGITDDTYGIYNAGGTTNIKEGSEISSTTGIYNAKGTVNIGETGTMNSNSPIITGESYGLVNATSATVYMYDGQIKGKTGATQGYITYTETGYSVATKTEGEYMIDYLALSGTISTVAQVNGIDFSNLQSAINSVTGDEAQTITLTNGIITTSTFTIAEGQNIILDMNGKTISSDLETTIINNGSLTIIDSSGNNVASISSTVGTAISNSGTLTLGQDDGTVTQDLINIEGATYGIINSGTLNFYDGTINGASAVSGSITSRATGYVIRTTTVNSKERYYLST